MFRRAGHGLQVSATILLACISAASRAQDASLGGFIPLVGIGLTDEFKNAGTDLTGGFFLADPELSLVGSPLSGGGSPYYDVALLDTGAATHILTQRASGGNGFDVNGNGFDGTNFQQVGGATGLINLAINDPLAIFAAGLGDRLSDAAPLRMDVGALRGQSSVATLSAPSQWQLPNILGLPMAAHHAISIRNDLPQIFQHAGRTIRTPQVDFIDLGTGAEQGILRRTDLKIKPGASFVAGPLYVQNLDFFGGFEFHENPLSPTVIENAAMFVDVDLAHDAYRLEDRELLFDTGADLTVVSQLTAKRLGFDAVLDDPDFVLQVEGSGGVQDGVPGFYLDELNIDTVGGSFTLEHVPIAVLDVTNPNDPGNIIDGIVGMHLFNGRNLVIDALPSIGQGGVGPSVYISDPVTSTHNWTAASTSDDWSSAANWTAAGSPSALWVANAANASGSPQRAVVASDSTVFQLNVSGSSPASMTVEVDSGAVLTVFGEARIDAGGEIQLSGGKLDAQFINIDQGVLSGSGEIFVGTGPIGGAVRNISGRIAPGDAGDAIGELVIEGDLVNLEDGILELDLGGAAVTQYDQLHADRFAFLSGALEVSLVDLGGGAFNPNSGNSFTLISAGDGVVGQFDQLRLPPSYQWDVDYLPNSVVLEVLGTIEVLDGDFNSSGSVDGEDLLVWESSFGSAYGGGDFLTWQRNLGAGGAGGGASVPEPDAAMLAILAAVALWIARPSVFRALRA